MVQNIYVSLCVHGLRRAFSVNSPPAGLGLTGLPCVILIAVFCSSLLCPVLCLSRRLGLSAAPAGIRTFPWKSGFCADRKYRFWLVHFFLHANFSGRKPCQFFEVSLFSSKQYMLKVHGKARATMHRTKYRPTKLVVRTVCAWPHGLVPVLTWALQHASFPVIVFRAFVWLSQKWFKTYIPLYVRMAFAGPFALTRRRPALALLVCLVSFLSPFSGRHCFARFCAFVVGWAFRRLRRESALSCGNRDFPLTKNPVFGLRKTSVLFAGLRPAGCESNRNIRGNFCSRLQKFPWSNSSIFQFRKFFWPLGRGAPSPYQLLAGQ